MQLGIFAKTFAGDRPEQVIAAAAAAGYTAVQYNMACSGSSSMPDNIAEEVTNDVVVAAARHQVEVVALSGTYNMIHPNVEVRAKGHERLSQLASAAGGMKTRLITLCTGTRDPDDQWRAHPENRSADAWKDLLASIEVAVEIAERYDIDLGIEPELANVIDSAESARRLLDEMGSTRLKIVLDPANLFEVASIEEQRRIVTHAIDLLADSIAMGHAKDRTATGGFTTAGKGVLDYPYYLSCLKSIGFDGPMITHGLAAKEAADVATFLSLAIEEAGLKVGARCTRL